MLWALGVERSLMDQAQGRCHHAQALQNEGDSTVVGDRRQTGEGWSLGQMYVASPMVALTLRLTYRPPWMGTETVSPLGFHCSPQVNSKSIADALPAQTKSIGSGNTRTADL